MTLSQEDVHFDDGDIVTVHFSSAVRGQSSVTPDVIDVHEDYVGVRWTLEGYVNTALVPWRNIVSIDMAVAE